MKEKIEEIFNALQELESIKTTPRNISILNGVFNLLRGIYHDLEVGENVGSCAENRSTVDSE
jgi:uncharacterized protein (UPF0147 family)